nr:hypothetical protein RKHAN_04089 [Rhizobium sp. Khangiran2]
MKRNRKATERHRDDYTALINWEMHDQIGDNETTSLVLELAGYRVRVSMIEGVMKQALQEELAVLRRSNAARGEEA